jgi:hypothetical protein
MNKAKQTCTTRVLKINGRTAPGRRWKQLRNLFLEEIGIEADRLSEVSKIRLGALTDIALELELTRSRQSRGHIVDPLTLNRLARTLSALSRELGIE